MISLFAHDTTAYNIDPNAPIKNRSSFQSIKRWLDLNISTVKRRKCEYVCSQFVQPLGTEEFDNGISLADHCKYTDVIINGERLFKKHLSHITKKPHKIWGFMYKVRKLDP